MSTKNAASATSLGQQLDHFVVAPDKRLFLGPRPPLDLPFSSDGISDVREMFCPDKNDGESLGGVAAVGAVVVETRLSRPWRADPT
jgi:hypothetical protein